MSTDVRRRLWLDLCELNTLGSMWMSIVCSAIPLYDRILKWSLRRNIFIQPKYDITGMSSGYCERCTDCAGAIVSTCGFDKCAYHWLYTFIQHASLLRSMACSCVMTTECAT